MKKVLLSIVIFIGLIVFFFAVRYMVLSTSHQTTYKKNRFQDASDRFIKGVNDCGPRTLRVICQLFGIKSTIKELAELAGTDETGTTMGGLYRSAKNKGLEPFGEVKLTIQELQKLNSPAIAFVNNNHFVVIEEFVDDKLRIIDPPRLPYLITRREFADIAVPVVVSPKRAFFGMMKAGEDTFRNIIISKGDIAGDIEIKHVENKSPFVSIRLVTLQPKRKYNLEITVSGKAPEGPIQDTIMVHTNQTEISIPVYGIVVK